MQIQQSSLLFAFASLLFLHMFGDLVLSPFLVCLLDFLFMLLPGLLLCFWIKSLPVFGMNGFLTIITVSISTEVRRRGPAM